MRRRGSLADRRDRHFGIEDQLLLEREERRSVFVFPYIICQLALHRRVIRIERLLESALRRNVSQHERKEPLEVLHIVSAVSLDQVMHQHPRLSVKDAPRMIAIRMKRIIVDREKLVYRDKLRLLQQVEMAVLDDPKRYLLVFFDVV